MKAIIESGGKQYRVAPGERIEVERLEAELGAEVEFSRVLFLEDEGHVEVGQPTVPGASVVGHVLSHDLDDKIVVFKYKAKVRYRRKTGHRQRLTRVRVTEIRRGATNGA